MTEQEARQKWCPFARVVDDLSGAGAAARLQNNTVKCVASDCMAWRWASGEGIETLGGSRGESKEAGYCGLAGKP